MKNRGPVESFRQGAWEVSVWKRHFNGEDALNMALRKSYKKGEEWQEQSISLFESEVERCIDLLKQGRQFILSKE
ncbi:hypothetical protein KAJ27_01625 [bacterium]|nr:hypothetical protein [bacterium]